MSEIFTIVCENISVAAPEDIFSVVAAGTKKLQILAIEMNANGQTTVGNYAMRLRYTASLTPGSGGASVTPINVNPDGAAPTSTCRRNDTAQGTGTFKDILATQFNPINGYYWQPPTSQEDAPKGDLSSAFVLSFDGTPGSAINISATLWFKEI